VEGDRLSGRQGTPTRDASTITFASRQAHPLRRPRALPLRLESPSGIEQLFAELKVELLKTFPPARRLHHPQVVRPGGDYLEAHSEIGRAGRNRRAFYALGYSAWEFRWRPSRPRPRGPRRGREAPWENLLYLHDPVAPLPPSPSAFWAFREATWGCGSWISSTASLRLRS